MNKEKYTPSHIANYFLWRAWEDGDKITFTKLNRLVYIAYGWNLLLNKERPKLFEQIILAWDNGFVIPCLYFEFRAEPAYKMKPIPKGKYSNIDKYGSLEEKSVPIVDNDERVLRILNAVWKNYKNKSSREFIYRLQEPWHKAYVKGRNTSLDDEDIKKMFYEEINDYLKNNK